MMALPKHRGFFDFFLPPKFLTMSSVGIDLSDESVKFVELVATQDGLRVGRFGEESIPNGAIFHGVIQNAQLVEKSLSSLQKKYGLSFARVACPEKETYLLELSLPIAAPEALREAVELQFEEYVPMKRKESFFDLDVVGVSEKKGTVRVQVSAISIALAEKYEAVFKSAGITPIAFEAESQALARAVTKESESKAALVVDIGKKETTVAIVHKGSVWFTSSFDAGGDMLTEVLSKELSLSYEEAEHIKCMYGILPSPEHKEVAEVILKHFQITEEKIRQHISYRGQMESEQNKEFFIERVVMCGGGSHIPGLAEYLSEKLLVPTALANPWANIISFDEYIPSISFGESLRYATVIGLAMPPAKINYSE